MSDHDDEEDRDTPTRTYEIGYCQPPVEHQFKPGHKLSKGRPRGSRNTKALVVEEWHRLRPGLVNGKRRRVSRSQKGASQITAKASDGHLKALEMVIKAEAELAEKAAGRAVASQFTEPGDELTMGDIVRRLRGSALAQDLPSATATDEPDEAAASDPSKPGSAEDASDK